MRLGAFLLSAVALAAAGPGPGQGPAGTAPPGPGLPWERSAPLAWQAEPLVVAEAGAARAGTPGDAPAGATGGADEASGPMTATLSGDGTLRVSDARGLIRVLAGLPGRPLRAWRNGGTALPVPVGSWRFPGDAPLSRGLGNLQWCADDFRPFLRGLLWVLEDGEAFLSVVHPATARLIHLPLPPGRDLRIRFLPDRLQVAAGEVEPGAPRLWSIPWMGLLPRLAALGPHPTPAPVGTALAPFPRE